MQKWATAWGLRRALREFGRRLAFAAGLWGAAAVSGFAAVPELTEITVDELGRRMAAGTTTSHEIAETYLARIAALDRAGPMLKAVIELNPDALAIADARDAERRAGKVRGPLHGVPVLIKDNIATGDRMETTAGSLALVGLKPPADAPLVARLREAGAVILGKTNLSEWANMRGSGSISGWSGRGGQTRNPYALDRTPSGSSSGSAVAVAANLIAVAVGTETTGSILSPAGVNGIVGFKPTVGLVSRTGVIPIAASFDTAGPMARTVRDAALLLDALAGPDPKDAATLAQPAGPPGGFAAALAPGALRGARLGVLRGPFDFRPNLDTAFEASLAVLRAAGAELVELGQYPALGRTGAARYEVMLYELKAGLAAYFATLGPDSRIKTLTDAIAFNRAHAAQELAFFGQQDFERAETKGPLTEPAYLEALDTCRRIARTEGIDRWVAEHRLDAVVAQNNAPAALADALFGGSTTGGAGYVLPAVAGYPSLTVPAGNLKGLPYGLCFFGPAWSDARILALGADFEARTKARIVPTFAPTLPRR